MSPLCLHFTSRPGTKNSSTTGTLIHDVLGVCQVGCPLSMVRIHLWVYSRPLQTCDCGLELWMFLRVQLIHC